MSDRSNEAAEMVQAAALEAIKAMKTLLDVAEAVVREPASAATVGRAFAEAASRVFQPNRDHHATSDDDGVDEHEEGQYKGSVRRINLSD